MDRPGLVTRVTAGPPRWTLVSAHLSFFLVLNASTAPNIALVPIGQEFGTSAAGLTWVINAYILTFASFLMLAATLVDRVGARRVFLAGLGLYPLASAGCLVVPSLAGLIAAQAVSGLAAAALAPTSLALISHACPDPARRARAVAAWAATGAVAVAAGPVVGGALVVHFGWRALFAFNLVGGLVVLAVAWRRVVAVPGSRGRGFDPVGQALAALCLCALTVAMVAVGRGGWLGAATLGGFGAAVVLAVAFVLVERSAAAPVVPFALFADRTFAATIGIAFLLNFAFYGQIFVLAFSFGAEYGPLRTGMALLPLTAALGVSNLTVGRLIGRIGARVLMVGGALVCAVGLFALALLGPRAGYGWLAGPLFLVGVGCGLVMPAMTTAMLAAVPPARFGVASGLLNSSRQMGGAVGVALFGSLISTDLAGSPPITQALAGAVLLVVCALSARYVPGRT